MRACFLGQNICALGNGIAIVQAKPFLHELEAVVDEDPLTDLDAPEPRKASAPALKGDARKRSG